MEAQLYSPARLADPEAISLLVLHLSRHLGARFAERVAGDTRVLTPSDQLRIVPLVFGLLPRSAVVRERYDLRVKPLITDHLQRLGVSPEPALVDVLKEVADQYFRTTPPRRERKFGIADIRAGDPRTYRRLCEVQNGRCAVCGMSLSGEEETLDHIVPWRLVGEVVDGSNWQILCRACNGGKSSFISSLQPYEALNWIYDEASGIGQPSLRTRYLALVRASGCTHAQCGAGPRERRLHVVPLSSDALPIVDHVQVLCEQHAPLN